MVIPRTLGYTWLLGARCPRQEPPRDSQHFGGIRLSRNRKPKHDAVPRPQGIIGREENTMIRQYSTRKRGFTLIEFSIVVAVLAVLAATLLPTMLGILDRARVRSARASMVGIQKTYARFYQDVGAWPGANGIWLWRTEGAEKGILDSSYPPFHQMPGNDPTLVRCSGTGADGRCWNGPYLLKSLNETRDPWGNHYRYYKFGPTASFAEAVGIECMICDNLSVENGAGGIIIYSMGRNGLDDTGCEAPASEDCMAEPDKMLRGENSAPNGDDIIVIVTATVL